MATYQATYLAIYMATYMANYLATYLAQKDKLGNVSHIGRGIKKNHPLSLREQDILTLTGPVIGAATDSEARLIGSCPITKMPFSLIRTCSHARTPTWPVLPSSWPPSRGCSREHPPSLWTQCADVQYNTVCKLLRGVSSTIQCEMYTGECGVQYSVQCTQGSVQYNTVCNVHRGVWSTIQCAMYTG